MWLCIIYKKKKCEMSKLRDWKGKWEEWEDDCAKVNARIAWVRLVVKIGKKGGRLSLNVNIFIIN